MNSSAFIGLGYNFLQLTINSIEELENQGNKNLLFLDGNLSEDESWLKYDQQTKWNDNNIAIPVLFNFYHGIELVLKGLILKSGKSWNPKKGHHLTLLLNTLKSCTERPSQNVIEHFEKIINYDLNNFFDANNKNVDSFYILLRYPEASSNNYFIFNDIRGLGPKGLSTFSEVRSLAKGVKENIKSWLSESNSQESINN